MHRRQRGEGMLINEAFAKPFGGSHCPVSRVPLVCTFGHAAAGSMRHLKIFHKHLKRLLMALFWPVRALFTAMNLNRPPVFCGCRCKSGTWKYCSSGKLCKLQTRPVNCCKTRSVNVPLIVPSLNQSPQPPTAWPAPIKRAHRCPSTSCSIPIEGQQVVPRRVGVPSVYLW